MIRTFLKKLENRKHPKPITIVSGLPRTGTSMMMKVLEAGGLPPLSDNIRTADVDNPNGYYEFERVKQLPKGDHTWLREAQGKVVKVVATLLVYLPDSYDYQVIFMHRAIPEVLASQSAMMSRRGVEPDQINDEEMAQLFQKHLSQVQAWLNAQANIKRIDLSYNQIVTDPEPLLEQLNQFLDNKLNVAKMSRVIEPNLYRQRGSINVSLEQF